MTTENETNKQPVICSICGLDIKPEPISGWAEGNNAYPINDGRCCNDCNQLVIMRRMNDIRRSLKRTAEGLNGRKS